MPQITFATSDRKAMARLDALLPDVRTALADALGPLAQEMTDDARNRALAHIRYEGKKPGAYLASIMGGTFEKGTVVGGYVRSGNPLAHLLEYGATLPEHEIYAKKGGLLVSSAGEIFGRHVHFPGAPLPAYPAITPSLDEARSRVETILEAVLGYAVHS